MRVGPLIVLLLAAACVPEPLSAPAPDATVRDAGERDAGLHDGGVRDAAVDAGEDPRDAGTRDGGRDAGRDAGPSVCPTSTTAACVGAHECLADIGAPSNCQTCIDYNHALCVDATCSEPPVLGPGDIYTVAITVDANVGNLVSFGTLVVAADTAGTLPITCAEVYSDTIDFTNRCYNVLDSRAYTVPQTGDTYAVSFTGFTSGQRTLFVVYGFDRTQADGTRLGVSCTEHDVEIANGSGPYLVTGDNMRRL